MSMISPEWLSTLAAVAGLLFILAVFLVALAGFSIAAALRNPTTRFAIMRIAAELMPDAYAWHFAAAIGWLAIVATTFFLSLARGTNASLWGMNLTVEADGGFQMMFDGQQLGVMLAGAAVIGALVGALLPARVRG